MPAHVMELPRRVVVGPDIISDAASHLKDLELGHGVLVVSGPNVRRIVENPLRGSLEKDEYKVSWVVVEKSSFEEVERVGRFASNIGADFLMGVGGGKSIDVAKLASFNCRIPFASVPTSASHDGIASPFGSVKGLDRPYSLVAEPPVAIIADTKIIMSAPRRLLSSGCGDLISKKTAVRDWELSSKKTGEYFGKYSANLALLSANLIIEDTRLISEGSGDGVSVVVEALISSGVAAGIAGSSRPCSGSEHLFSHAMDIVAPGKGLHGTKCGIGTIMMAKLHGIDHEEIRESLETVGSPTKASEIGVEDKDIIKALVLARSIRKERYTILDEAKLDEDSARELARKVGVIS